KNACRRFDTSIRLWRFLLQLRAILLLGLAFGVLVTSAHAEPQHFQRDFEAGDVIVTPESREAAETLTSHQLVADDKHSGARCERLVFFVQHATAEEQRL